MKDFFLSETEKHNKQSISAKMSSWFNGNQKKTVDEAADGLLNDHSKAIFLMAPDNKFLNFYRLDLTEKELAEQIIEDASYDIGSTHIGTTHRPEENDARFIENGD